MVSSTGLNSGLYLLDTCTLRLASYTVPTESEIIGKIHDCPRVVLSSSGPTCSGKTCLQRAIVAGLRCESSFTLNKSVYSIPRKAVDRSRTGSGIPGQPPNHLTSPPQFYQRVVATVLRRATYVFPDPFPLVHTMNNSRVDEETPLLFSTEDPVVTISGGSDQVATPLPKLQIGILLSVLLTEPICSKSISPFINQVTHHYGHIRRITNRSSARQRAGYHRR